MVFGESVSVVSVSVTVVAVPRMSPALYESVCSSADAVDRQRTSKTGKSSLFQSARDSSRYVGIRWWLYNETVGRMIDTGRATCLILYIIQNHMVPPIAEARNRWVRPGRAGLKTGLNPRGEMGSQGRAGGKDEGGETHHLRLPLLKMSEMGQGRWWV